MSSPPLLITEAYPTKLYIYDIGSRCSGGFPTDLVVGNSERPEDCPSNESFLGFCGYSDCFWFQTSLDFMGFCKTTHGLLCLL